jgi:phage terminase small subunit
MAALTPRERRFVVELFMPGVTAASAAQIAGFGNEDGTSKRETLARIARRKMTRPHIVAAIQEEQRHVVRALAPSAVRALREILGNRAHKDRLKAARTVFARTDPEQVDHHHQHDHRVTVVDHEAETLKALRWMLDAGVPRKKLLEHFGFTGLSRYERMLEERERRDGPKLIEASPEAPGSVTAVPPFRVGEPDDDC